MTWRERAQQLKGEITALGYACTDARVPWYAKVVALCVVAYALSPLDLIPDPIPILGYVDDLVLLPLGIFLVVRMIPPAVMAECRERACVGERQPPAGRWVVMVLIVLIWIAVTLVLARALWNCIARPGP